MAENGVITDDDVDTSRRKFLTTATVATGAVGAAFALVPFVSSWKPSERARALGAPTELDLSKLEPGQMTIVTWRKQQIYVVKRTPEMLQSLAESRWRAERPEVRGIRAAGVREERSPRRAARLARAHRRLHASGLSAEAALRARHGRARRGLAGRLLLPLPRLEVRPRRPRVRGLARLGEPAHSALHDRR